MGFTKINFFMLCERPSEENEKSSDTLGQVC